MVWCMYCEWQHRNAELLIFRVMAVGLRGTCESASVPRPPFTHVWYLVPERRCAVDNHVMALRGPAQLSVSAWCCYKRTKPKKMHAYWIEILHLQRIFRWTLDQKSWHRMGLVQQQRWWPFLIAGPVSKFLSHCIQYTLFVVCKRLENSNL